MQVVLTAGDSGAGCFVAGRNVRHGYGAIKTREQSGLRRHFHFFALAGNDVHRPGCKPDSEAARHVAEQNTDQRATASTNRHAEGVAFVVVLLLDHFTLRDFHVAAFLTVRIDPWLTDCHQAHLDGNQATVNFYTLEGHVQIRLAAESGEILSLLNRADDAVQACAGRDDNTAVKGDGLREDCDDGIALEAAERWRADLVSVAGGNPAVGEELQPRRSLMRGHFR